jgi:hypothetical protein
VRLEGLSNFKKFNDLIGTPTSDISLKEDIQTPFLFQTVASLEE